MKPVRFHPEAETELAAEARYYEERSSGLGEQFTREVEAAVELASAFLLIGSPYRYATRRVFPKRFPFSVSTGRLVPSWSYSPSLPFRENQDTGADENE